MPRKNANDSNALMNEVTLSAEFRSEIEDKISLSIKEHVVKKYDSIEFPDLFKTGKDVGFIDKLRFGDGTVQCWIGHV